jgi:hypothetical protein
MESAPSRSKGTRIRSRSRMLIQRRRRRKNQCRKVQKVADTKRACINFSLILASIWRVPGLRMEERPPVWRVAANIFNKQSRTADMGWSSSLGVGEGLTTPHCENEPLLRNLYRQSLGPGSILWYNQVWTGLGWLRIETGGEQL